MSENEEIFRQNSAAVYAAAEADANRFNLISLVVLSGIAVLAEGLNDLGVFVVDPRVMQPSMAVALILFLIPLLLWVTARDRKRRLEDPRFKFIIIFSVFGGIAVVATALSFHAILLLVVPGVMAGQYRDQRRLFLWILIGTVLLIPMGVYGGLFFGVPDRNLLKGVAGDGYISFAERMAVATPDRLWEIFLHHALPRFLCVLAIDLLLSGIPRRNTRMTEQLAVMAERVHREMEERNEIQSHVIEALASVIETRDEGTGDHVERTKAYVDMILREMAGDDAFRDRLTPAEIEEIRNAAPLHDVGKIAISDTILLKPGRLTDKEFDRMREHTVIGGKMIRSILSGIDSPSLLKHAEEIAVSHHEKWDGSGYPCGLAGEDIPLSARVMAVADVFDALVSRRVYKEPIPPEAALDTILAESGTHFDPEIIRVVRGMRKELLDAARSPVTQIRNDRK